MFARRQTEAQDLLEMPAGFRRSPFPQRLKQMMLLLQRVTAVR